MISATFPDNNFATRSNECALLFAEEIMDSDERCSPISSCGIVFLIAFVFFDGDDGDDDLINVDINTPNADSSVSEELSVFVLFLI